MKWFLRLVAVVVCLIVIFTVDITLWIAITTIIWTLWVVLMEYMEEMEVEVDMKEDKLIN